MKRREFIAGTAALLVSARHSHAQGKRRRLGFLTVGDGSGKALNDGLRWRGVVEFIRRLISRVFSLALLSFLGTVGVFSSARALTQDEIVAKLEAAGYSQIREMPAGKIKSFKAVKNGRETSIMIDSTGHIKELQQ